MLHANGDFFAADRASSSAGFGFTRLQAQTAGTVAVPMVLALLGEKFQRSRQRGGTAPLLRIGLARVRRFNVQQVGLAPKFGGRMGI